MNTPLRIDGYELDRLEVPAGRVIGDNNCAYDSFDLVVLRLKTNQGLIGWGYGESVWKGQFDKPAWWVKPAASLDALRKCFVADWWPHLHQRTPSETKLVRQNHTTQQQWLDRAVGVALWDLMAKQVDLPLYKMLGKHADRIKAYGSILDYPQEEEQAVALTRNFIDLGFKAIKVKVGAPDVQRDIQRLLAIQHAAGEEVELTADANIAWDADTTVERIKAFEQAGIRLGYIEDPIPHNRIDEYSKLAGRLDIDVVGHDYISTTSEMRDLLQTGALQCLRAGAGIDLILENADLAKQFDVAMILGNSLFEMNVHAACALPGVDRLEFSDLAWNRLVKEPVRFEEGFAFPPTSPGHGLELHDEVFLEYCKPNASSLHEYQVLTEKPS